MTIVFVGDKPSAKNKNPDVPFVGTQSYKRLLEWIWEMDLNISNILLHNKDWVKRAHFSREVYKLSIGKVVALGLEASKELDKYKIEHFKLDHPSGLNRKLNDKKYVKQQLKACKEWLNE